MSKPRNKVIPGERTIYSITRSKIRLHPGSCPKRHGLGGNTLVKDCELCAGTNRDPIPWTELERTLRVRWKEGPGDDLP